MIHPYPWKDNKLPCHPQDRLRPKLTKVCYPTITCMGLYHYIYFLSPVDERDTGKGGDAIFLIF